MIYKLVLVSPLSLWNTQVSSSPRERMECLLFSLFPVVLWLLVQDLRSSRMLHSSGDWHLVTDVSGNYIGPIFKGQVRSSNWTFKMKTKGCPETSVTTNQRSVTSHKANFSFIPRRTREITLRAFHCTCNLQSPIQQFLWRFRLAHQRSKETARLCCL
jgi:hypothetical protein